MHRTVNDLIRIAAAGGGFTLDARLFSVGDLIRIVAAAGNENTRIDVAFVDELSTDDLVKIAVACKGSLSFVQ